MILCADDYGISPGVTAGILRLLERGRLSAVSCMTTEPESRSALARLRPNQGNLDIGLHLVLTETAPLSRPGLASGLLGADGAMPSPVTLVRRAYLGGLDGKAVEGELRAQIDLFSDAVGRFPDFIDGHQHVQQLPTVREALVRVVAELDPGRTCYCRNAGLPPGGLWRCARRVSPALALHNAVVAAPARRTARVFDERGIPHNRRLLGCRAPDAAAGYPELFEFYLSLEPGPRDIFFCHPGYVDDALRRRDPLTEFRPAVLKFLESRRCAESLARSGTALNTFRAAVSPQTP